MNEELKARLENIRWRTNEGLKSLDNLIQNIDLDKDDEALKAFIDLKDAWFGGIKANVDDILNGNTDQTENIQVSHPSHYNRGSIECIDALKSALGPEGYKGFCAGNVIKYVWRYQNKNGVKDVQKAKNYLKYLQEFITEEGKENET